MSASIEALLASSAPSAVEADPAVHAGPVDGDSSFEGILSGMVDAAESSAPAEAEPVTTAETPEAIDVETEQVAAVALGLVEPVAIDVPVEVHPVSDVLAVSGEAATPDGLPETLPEAEGAAAATGTQTVVTSVPADLRPVVASAPEPSASVDAVATSEAATEPAASSMPMPEATSAETVPETTVGAVANATAPEVVALPAEVLPEATSEVAETQPEAQPAEPVVLTAAQTSEEAVSTTPEQTVHAPTVPTDEAPAPTQVPADPFKPRIDVEDAPKLRSSPFAAPETPIEEAAAEPQPTVTPTTSQVAVAVDAAPAAVETTRQPADAREGESRATVELGPTMEVAARAETSKPDAPAAATELDPSRFVDRVVRFVRTMVGRNESSLEMRLNPPELGSVRLTMTMKEGELRMAMQTTTESARQVIAQHLDGLRATLVQQGYDVARLEVSVGGDFVEQQAAQSDAQPRHFTRGQGGAMPTTDGEAETEPVAVSLANSRYLNLVA